MANVIIYFVHLVGETPLLHAARQGHTETAKYLLDHGADPTIPSELGAIALHHSAGIGVFSPLLMNAQQKNVFFIFISKEKKKRRIHKYCYSLEYASLNLIMMGLPRFLEYYRNPYEEWCFTNCCHRILILFYFIADGVRALYIFFSFHVDLQFYFLFFK